MVNYVFIDRGLLMGAIGYALMWSTLLHRLQHKIFRFLLSHCDEIEENSALQKSVKYFDSSI
jgi:hypothetical protein